MRKVLLLLSLLLISFFTKGQLIVRGKIISQKTKEPLAFVNIIIKTSNLGTTSDIDGRFQLTLPANKTELIFSYVGFETRIVFVTVASELVIQMKEKATQLREVIVRPSDNPAFRIIRQVIQNKPLNDPENLSSFSYNSYNKLYSTLLDVDSTTLINEQADSAKFKKYIRNNHLFIHESYTERKYLKPNLSKEVVLGNHLSGIKDPFIAFVATDLQPFSFYKDFIFLFNQNYVSPLSPGSTEKYDFTLMDTVYHRNDSIYVIAFEPLPDKIFDGLKGQLYISTDGYAIEHVLAQPADDKVLIESVIQQKYEKINGHWFPIQLNSELRFKKFTIGNLKLKYVSHSYLSNIEIGPPLNEKEFGLVSIELSEQANRQDELFWNAHRNGTFDRKEKNTFTVLDSLGEKIKTVQTAFKILEGLFIGRFKVGSFYIPVEPLVQFNQYEGARVGIGVQTGEQISKRFNLEAYGGYGFNDKALKYGAAIQVNLNYEKEAYVKLSYRQDLLEPGKSNFIKSAIATRTQESLRNWMTSRMDSVEEYKGEFSIHPFRYSQLDFFFQEQKRNPAYAYSYHNDKDTQAQTKFVVTEAGIQWRFAFKETYMKIGQSKIVTAMSYPQVNLFLSHGFTGLASGQYNFTKIESRVDHQFLTRGLGKTTFQLASGYLDGRVPYPYLFNGKGSKFDQSLLNNLVVLNYFQTMGLYEFFSDRYAYLFLNQHIGRITGNKIKYFRPELSLIHNMGIGSLKHKDFHKEVPFKTMEKGYFESGMIVSNIIRFNYVDLIYFGFGAGVFYRYGNYALPESSDNFAIKLVFTLSF